MGKDKAGSSEFLSGDVILWCDEEIGYILDGSVVVDDPMEYPDDDTVIEVSEMKTSIGVKIYLVSTGEIFDVHTDTVDLLQPAINSNADLCNLPHCRL